ncbi:MULTISPECIES: hypothetical protein [Aerosakkonema]|uniref:hypothetical protein n=1 Tax=Aerosakkonema TaxID=1246629 RepID=UPI0035B999AA
MQTYRLDGYNWKGRVSADAIDGQPCINIGILDPEQIGRLKMAFRDWLARKKRIVRL